MDARLKWGALSVVLAAIVAAVVLAVSGASDEPNDAGRVVPVSGTADEPDDVWIDGASLGATCSDSYTLAQAGSPDTPWCSPAPFNGLSATDRSDKTYKLRPATYSTGFAVEGGSTTKNVTIRSIGDEDPEVPELTLYDIDHLIVQNVDVPLDARFDVRTSTGFTLRGAEGGQVRIRNVDEVLVEGNHFHHNDFETLGADGFCACGIYLYTQNVPPNIGVSDAVIRDNIVDSVEGDGIHLNTTKRVLVEGNTVLDNGKAPENPDDHVDALQLVNGEDTEVRGNLMAGSLHGILITDTPPVDGSDEDNRATVIANNVVHTIGTDGVALNGPVGKNGLVVNNTFLTEAGDLSAISSCSWLQVEDPPAECSSPGAVVFNNIFNQSFSYGSEDAGQSEDHNAYELLGGSGGGAPNDIAWTPPALADWRKDGYRLPEGAAPVDAGVRAFEGVTAPSVDMRGRARVGATDLGAKERG